MCSVLKTYRAFSMFRPTPILRKYVMRFTNGRAPTPTKTSEASFSPQPLRSSAVVALDLEPLANELRKRTEPVQEVLERQHDLSHAVERLSECERQRATSSAEQLQGIAKQLDRLDEFNTAFQRSLQHFETAQQRLAEHYIRETFLRPLAKKTLSLWRTISQVVGEDPFASSSLLSELEGLLDHFGIALILPNGSDPFDAQTMKPKVGTHRGQYSCPVVADVCQPGARYGDYVLVHAFVEVREQSATADLEIENEACSLGHQEATTASASEREMVSRI